VKTQRNKIHQSLAASLLVMYVIVAFVFTFTLPKINHIDADRANLSHRAVVAQSNSSNAATNFFHRGMRSIIEHKQKVVIPTVVVSIIFLAFIFGKIELSNTTFKDNVYLKAFHTQPGTYLSLGILRI
jgi:hypothetical protein